MVNENYNNKDEYSNLSYQKCEKINEILGDGAGGLEPDLGAIEKIVEEDDYNITDCMFGL